MSDDNSYKPSTKINAATAQIVHSDHVVDDIINSVYQNEEVQEVLRTGKLEHNDLIRSSLRGLAQDLNLANYLRENSSALHVTEKKGHSRLLQDTIAHILILPSLSKLFDDASPDELIASLYAKRAKDLDLKDSEALLLHHTDKIINILNSSGSSVEESKKSLGIIISALYDEIVNRDVALLSVINTPDDSGHYLN